MYPHMHAWRGRVGAAAWRRCVLVELQGVEGGRSAGACARGASMPVCRHGGVAGSDAALHAKVRSMVAVGRGARRGGRDGRADGLRVSRQSLRGLSNEGNTAWVEGRSRA